MTIIGTKYLYGVIEPAPVITGHTIVMARGDFVIARDGAGAEFFVQEPEPGRYVLRTRGWPNAPKKRKHHEVSSSTD